ncbi:hypothetical protein COE15_03185 [Bacillus cereus]|nr:hypothetical protein CN288_03665 [Bacillus sp. AFS023182]PGY04285.1 hypothetical protein COE15_03185 [Bacillus cereus]
MEVIFLFAFSNILILKISENKRGWRKNKVSIYRGLFSKRKGDLCLSSPRCLRYEERQCHNKREIVYNAKGTMIKKDGRFIFKGE